LEQLRAKGRNLYFGGMIRLEKKTFEVLREVGVHKCVKILWHYDMLIRYERYDFGYTSVAIPSTL